MEETGMLSREENQLTDTQILTLIIGITFPVLGLIGAIASMIHANKRIDEAVVSMNKRMEDFEKRVIERIDGGFEHMTLLLKLHEAEHHKH
jgi:hypothetical protein